MPLKVRTKVFPALLTIVAVVAASLFFIASPAFAATTANGSLSGPLAAGGTTTVTAQFVIEPGTSPLPAQVSARLAPSSPDATGTVTISDGTGSVELSGCATSASGTDCDWTAPAEGQTAVISATLTASTDAAGTFTLEFGEIVAGEFVPLGSLLFAIAPPADDVDGTLSVPEDADVNETTPGFELSVSVGSGATGSSLPVRLGIQFARTSGAGSVTLSAPEGPGLTGCVTGPDVVTCEWAAASGDSTAMSLAARFSDVSTWTITGFYVNGDGAETVFADTGITTVSAVTAPPVVPDPEPEPEPGPELAESGVDASPLVFGAVGGGFLLLGVVLVAMSRRGLRSSVHSRR